MERPTANDVREWSRLDFAAHEFPESVDPDDSPDSLDQALDEAVAYVEQVTGRVPLTEVPLELVPLARAAVRMRVEQLVIGGNAETIEEAYEALADAGIQSFSVPGYSETRFRPEAAEVYKRLSWWPALAEVLWLLMTPEAREEYVARLTGQHAPGFAVTEVDWGAELLSTPLDPFEDYSPGWY